MALGLFLIDRGWITKEGLDVASAEAAAAGERLDRHLTRTGLVPRERVLAALADQFQMPMIDLSTTVVDQAVLSLVPARVIYGQRCVPVASPPAPRAASALLWRAPLGGGCPT